MEILKRLIWGEIKCKIFFIDFKGYKKLHDDAYSVIVSIEILV